MSKVFGICLFLFLVFHVNAQEVSLPEDLRQHNLTQFNASLLNPTYSYDWNRPQALSLWSRWQWQTIDGDPTSLFVSYSHRLNEASSLGGGFLQHNTGTFLNTGGLVNYVHSINFRPNIKLLLGANVLAFQQELADDRFMPDPDIDLPQFRESNDFLVQFTPGMRLLVNSFSVALSLENALDFNLTDSSRDGLGNIFIGALSNDFPINIASGLGESYVRPVLYVKTIPNADTQIGLNTLLSTSKFWLQGGYNNFYGPSVGLGATFFKHFSLGGLMEFPTGSDLEGEDATFAFLLSYHFGDNKSKRSLDNRRKVVGFGPEEDEVLVDEMLEEKEQGVNEELTAQNLEEQKRLEEVQRSQQVRDSINQATAIAEQERIQDSIAMAKAEEAEAIREQQRLDSIAEQRQKEAEKLLEQRRSDSIAALNEQEKQLERIREQQRLDSIARQRQKEAEALFEQQRLDSIAKLQQEKEVEVKPGEKYEEVTTADGLQPGFYLIANVFGTKKYFENFMKTLTDKGLNPKSFFRKLNGYNYVYLERYDTIEEARRARDNNFYGRYPDKTWVFRVRNE